MPPLQGFSSRKTGFYFHQFLSNFFKYSFSNFLLFYLYNIFTIYFSSNFFLLMSLFLAIFKFSYLLTSISSLPLNFAIIFSIFSRSSSVSHKLCSTINLFYCNKYFTFSCIFLLFKIFSTFYSLTPFTSTGFTSSIFYFSTCFLYYTTQLIFITG